MPSRTSELIANHEPSLRSGGELYHDAPELCNRTLGSMNQFT